MEAVPQTSWLPGHPSSLWLGLAAAILPLSQLMPRIPRLHCHGDVHLHGARKGECSSSEHVSSLIWPAQVPGAVMTQSRMLKDRRSLSKGPLLVGAISALSSLIVAPMSGLARGHLEVHVAMYSRRAPQLAEAVQRQGIRDGKVTFLPQTICSGSVENFHLFGPYCCSWDNFMFLSCRD